MTAVIREAEARRSASRVMNSWTRLSLTGEHVGWIRKTSWPRTDSWILTSNSPSAKRVMSIWTSGRSISRAMRSLSSGLPVPERSMRSPWGLNSGIGVPQPSAVAPPLDGPLAGPAHREGALRDVAVDNAGRGDVGAPADSERGDQTAVAADKDVVTDGCPVLGPAIVIAGDGAGADVDPSSDVAI